MIALLCVAVVLGGGGSPSPGSELFAELAAAAILVSWAIAPGGAAGVDRRAWWLIGLTLIIPAVQLIPLPPALWHALPGREREVAALGLIGRSEAWMPWSLAPHRTLASLAAMIPPAIMLWLVARLDLAGRRAVIAAVAALALFSSIIGAAQLAGGTESPLRFYSPSHAANLTAFFANRNAAADLFLVGLLALAATWAGHAERRRMLPFALAGGALIGFALILTASRAGLLLATVAIVLVLAIVRSGPSGPRNSRRIFVWLALALSALGALALANPALRTVAARFGFGGEARPGLWQDTLHAIATYWPMGSGMGTFSIVFPAAERLEAVDVSVPNRAHNELLELALEGGLPALLVLAAIVILLGTLALRGLKSQQSEVRRQSLFAGGALILLGLHSVVDYPLRSIALATIAGLTAGLLVPERITARMRDAA